MPETAQIDTVEMRSAREVARVSMQQIRSDHPFRNVYISMLQSNRADFVEGFMKSRADDVSNDNAVARAFRANPRGEVQSAEALAKAGAPDVLMKASLDVGTITNFAQITGGQTLGYVSLDTQLARSTVRPQSFTLYQCLPKSRAFQVVDYWGAATDTGGAPPGAAFANYNTQTVGTLATNAGLYNLDNITLKLMEDGRALTMALGAQNNYVDVASSETINAALSILGTANWASYWGNPTFYPNQFLGAAGQIPSGNVVDYQSWYTANAVAQGWSPQQALFNLIYQWAGFITSYGTYGRITHAFMSPTCAGSLQGLVTTLLNNIVTEVTPHMAENSPVVVNGDLQGMRTRFGEIKFPIDLFITARDKPLQAVIQGNGLSQATSVNPTPPSAVAVVLSGATNPKSNWSASYATGAGGATSGYYTYAVASTDSSSMESNLTYATPISGILPNGAYVVGITGVAAADAAAYRVYRSGLGERQPTNNPLNPASYRFIGTVAASGSGAVTFVDLNAVIPGSETIFLFDMDERDDAIDWRYLLPLTKVELFANNLYMPWAVVAIGGIRLKIGKFHGIIKNYVGDNPVFNPLAANPFAV